MKTGNHIRILLTTACLAFSSAIVTQAPAQDAEAPAVETPALSDEKLQSFAVAFAEVNKVAEEYSQKVQEVDTEAEQQGLEMEAGQKMVEAVQNTDGISVDEYNEVLQAVQTDPDLAARLNSFVGETQ